MFLHNKFKFPFNVCLVSASTLYIKLSTDTPTPEYFILLYPAYQTDRKTRFVEREQDLALLITASHRHSVDQRTFHWL